MATDQLVQKVSIEDVVRLLNKLNLRITPQRIYITKVILENIKSHPSFKEIYEIVKKEMPSIGVSTLFNTLKVLEKYGVIELFEYNGETHIDLPKPHINIYCENKKKIIDLEDEELQKIVSTIVKSLEEKGYKIKNSTIVIKAYCNN